MKKRLLATTALSLLVVAGPHAGASAAERINVKVGGYMEQFVGYVDQDDVAGQDTSGFDIKSDTEIWFQGETMLDNGISFGINVQLEGNTDADQIDESYLTAQGSFGKLILGSENSAMYLLHVAPTDFGFGLNSGDNVEWLNFTGIGGNDGVFRGPFASTYVEPGRVNDANRLTYITPSFGGFQLGASYVPDAVEDSVITIDKETTLHDGVTVAAEFTRNVGPLDVAASAGWGTMAAGDSTTASDPTAYSFGLSLGYGKINVSAAFAGAEDDPTVGDMSGFTVGAAYTPGPWKIAITGFFSERDGSAAANAGGAGPREASFDTVQLEGGYDLGPGVSLVGVLSWAELQDESGLGTDNEAVYGVTMVRLSF